MVGPVAKLLCRFLGHTPHSVRRAGFANRLVIVTWCDRCGALMSVRDG